MCLHNDRVSLEGEVHQGNNQESTQISIYFMFRCSNNFLMIFLWFHATSQSFLMNHFLPEQTRFTYFKLHLFAAHSCHMCLWHSLSLSLCFPLCLGCYLQMLSRSWANQKYAKFCLCCQRRLKGKPFDMVANLLKWVKDVSLTCCKVNNTQQQQQ